LLGLPQVWTCYEVEREDHDDHSDVRVCCHSFHPFIHNCRMHDILMVARSSKSSVSAHSALISRCYAVCSCVLWSAVLCVTGRAAVGTLCAVSVCAGVCRRRLRTPNYGSSWTLSTLGCAVCTPVCVCALCTCVHVFAMRACVCLACVPSCSRCNPRAVPCPPAQTVVRVTTVENASKLMKIDAQRTAALEVRRKEGKGGRQHSTARQSTAHTASMLRIVVSLKSPSNPWP